MQKLVFDRGYKEYQIGDDENAVIRINTTDVGILARLNEAVKNIEQIQKKSKTLKKPKARTQFSLSPSATRTSESRSTTFSARMSARLPLAKLTVFRLWEVSRFLKTSLKCLFLLCRRILNRHRKFPMRKSANTLHR